MNTRSFLNVLVVLAMLLSFAPAQAASGLAQPPDPNGSVSQVATPDSIQGRVPIVLYASRGVAPFRITPRVSPALYRAQSATFTINYIPAGTQNALGDNCLTWPAGSKAAFQYAADLWGALLNSSVPIKIDACWASLGEGVLGHSATDNFYSNFTGAPQTNTWYSVALANALSGADQNGNTAEMHIAYSDNGISWYFGTDGNPSMGQYDFVSVVLHEIAHGLNFAGSMRVSSGVGSWGFTGYTGVPVIYDRFTENGSSQALINTSLFPNPSTQLAAQLTSNNIYFNGTYANAANGGQRPKLYAPSTWQGGSSYAHLDYDTFKNTANALMLWAIDDGTAIHDPGPVTCGIFLDLGWQNACQTASSPLTLDKSVALTHNPARPGDPITYTIVVRNTSVTDTVGVHITDTLPAYVVGANLDTTRVVTGNSTVTITVPATVASNVPSGATITNTAFFSHTSGGGSDSASFAVSTLLPDLSTSTKQVNATTVRAGGLVTFTILLSNTGLAATVRYTDTLPTQVDWVSGSLNETVTVNAGASTLVVIVARTNRNLTNGTVFNNTVAINDGVHPVFNIASPNVTVQSPDFSTSVRSVNKSVFEPGDHITYTLTLVNSGGVGATIRYTETLPDEVTWVSGALSGTAFVNAGDSSVPLIVVAQVKSDLANGVTFHGHVDINDGYHPVYTLDFPVAEISAPPSAGDAYEPDDTCAQAKSITTDGTVQAHTFHIAGDQDWVSFQGISGTVYLVEAMIPNDSPADVSLQVYDHCGGGTSFGQDNAFSPDVRLRLMAPSSGAYYLRLTNHDANVAGPTVAYHLSVRALAPLASPGAVIIVAGKLRDDDDVQRNIHNVTNAVYRLFKANGYPADRIRYLATDLTLNPDGQGGPDVYTRTSKTALQEAITQWAPTQQLGPERAFTLYLMDHGNVDAFYLNGKNQALDPTELEGWLSQLEAAAPGVKVNVIIEACYSGSFIALAQSISKPGRVVIASTAADTLAHASRPPVNGAMFSDAFIAALGRGNSLYGSFVEARAAVMQQTQAYQVPWLDDDGDSQAETGEGQTAAVRGFAYAGSFADGEQWPPYVASAGVGKIQSASAVITAEVRDDGSVSSVWAEVYPPSYAPPTSSEEMVATTVPTVTLTYNATTGLYQALYTNFVETGPYRVVVYATDNEGLMARPREIGKQYRLYLPQILRN